VLPEIFRKYPESSEKYSKSFQHFWCVWWPIENIQENIQKIFRKYSENIQTISSKYSENIQKIFRQYPESI
jgi:hypothetical protein